MTSDYRISLNYSTQPLLDALTVQLEYFDQQVGQKWVISGSDPEYSMGQWVIWVSDVDPVATLLLSINVTWSDKTGLIAA